MNPIEILKQGIENTDWSLIGKAYTSMTGEDIDILKVIMIETDHEIIENCVKNLNIILYRKGMESIIEEIKETGPEVKSDPPQKSRKRKKSTVSNENLKLMMEDGEPSKGFATLEEERQANIEIAATARKRKVYRKPQVKYDIECNECGNTFKSTTGKSEYGQKCSKCLKGIAKN